MCRSRLILTALAVLACAGCPQKKGKSEGKSSDQPSADKPAAPAPAVVSDADGNQVGQFEATPSADKCTFTTTETHRVFRDKEGALALTDAAGTKVGSIGGTPVVMLRGANGKNIGRVVHPPRLDAVSVIDAQGIAVFRIRIDDKGRAIVRDKASMPVLLVHNRGGRFVAETKDGTVRAYVTGERDPMVAALLTAEFVEPRLRGLLACDWAIGRTKTYVP